MTVCQLCHSLDYQELFQDEVRELSWLSEDISVLYLENRNLLKKIQTLNIELENSVKQEEFYEDSLEIDTIAANADEVLEHLQQEDSLLQIKQVWLSKEDQLRQSLVQQVLHLSQDLHHLRLQLHPLPRHLWGHATRLWRSVPPPERSPPPHRPSPSCRSTGTRETRKAKLWRWMRKRLLQT